MGTFYKPTSIFISNTPHSYVIHSPPSSSVWRLTVKLPTLALKFSQSRNISRHFEWELKNPYQCANNKIHSTTNTVAKHIFISSLHLLPNTKKSSEFCIPPPFLHMGPNSNTFNKMSELYQCNIQKFRVVIQCKHSLVFY